MQTNEEASPICRGKNLSWETVMLFYNYMPKEPMPKEKFNAYVEANINGWTQTHSQIARQLAFYYEENGICYPRFDKETTLAEIFEYMVNWGHNYFIPNPYAPSLKDKTPTSIYSYLMNCIKRGVNNFDEALDSMFEKPLSSHDKVKVYLQNYTNIKFDKGIIELNDKLLDKFNLLTPTVDAATNSKDYFFYYGFPKRSSLQKRQLKIYSGSSLQQIFYGAPGTGKSHAIKDITKGGEVVRTTFHPDSDYSTFVGAYKPTIEKGKCRILDKQDLIRELLEFKKQGSNYPLHSFATEYWESFKKLSSQDINEVLSTCQFNASYADEVNKCTAIGERLLAGKSDTKIVYSFVPQAFLNAYVQAWESYPNPIYLVIEEINRGNCAQIFGDLFQLLDRNTAGFSEYPIITDNDMSRYLKDMFVQKGHFTQDAERCADIDNQYSNEYESVTEGVKSGELLLLPNNLHILATMNTSDQSLFPIDSAFKRRWDWKYIKISNGYEKGDDGEYLKDTEGHKIPLGWEIDIKDKDGNNYDWWQFLQKINSIINYMTASADKQLGYFFCKAIDKKISADVFVNKVLFYLWNDVFKDYAIDEGSLFTYKKDGSEDPIDITFPNFYDEDGNVDTSTVSEFIENVMAWSNEDVE